jgi:hypothetical protein
MRSIKLSLILLTLLTPLFGMAEEVYRTVNERGQVIFTDTLPENRPVEVIELAPGPSERSVKEAEARQETLRSRLEAIQKQKEYKEEIHTSKIKEAKKALKTAEDELAVAREIKDGDWQMTVSGRRHLKPEYYDRINEAELAVELAREHLNKVKNQR